MWFNFVLYFSVLNLIASHENGITNNVLQGALPSISVVELVDVLNKLTAAVSYLSVYITEMLWLDFIDNFVFNFCNWNRIMK